MDINLEKVDIIRERTGVSYKEAKEALENSGGDIVDALISLEARLETRHDKKFMENMTIAGNEMIEKLKALIKKGNVSRIVLRKDGEVLVNVPVTTGAIGAILGGPIASLVGLSAAIATKTTLEIVKTNGEVVDLGEIADDTWNSLKNMMKINPRYFHKMDEKNKVDKFMDEEKTIDDFEEED